MRPVSFSKGSLAAAVANSLALAQTLAGAGSLTLNGALASGGVATIAVPSRVTLASTANLSAINFTITGTDYRGLSVSEVLAGPNNNMVTSVGTYATITDVAASAAVGTNVTMGNAQSGSSSVCVMDQYLNPFNATLGLEISGTANVTVQYTDDDVFVATSLDALVWNDHTDLTTKTANTVGTLISAVRGVRMVVNSGSGTGTLKVNQSGAAS
jgi:hypothetical protein